MRPIVAWATLSALTVLVPRPTTAQEEEGPDHARRRWEYFYQQRAFPFDRIPAGAYARARAQLQSQRAFLRSAALPPPITGTTWTPIGPEQIPIFGTSIGRLSAIAVHPTNSNTIYVGGAQGGVWKTTNGGANWTPMTDKECSLAMGALAIDPVNPEIVYAGTGEQHFSGDSYYGCGVLRSEDGGATWTQLGAAVFKTASGGARISRLAIVPSTAGAPATTTVFAASDFGLFRSTDGGANWTDVLGVYFDAECATQYNCAATDLVINPDVETELYVAVRRQGVYKSVDGGTSWTLLTNGILSGLTDTQRINLALAPSAPNTVYASIQSGSSSSLAGIWKTTNGGTSWMQLTADNVSCSSQCWYDQVIAVDPANPDNVYFGGVALFKSIDGGQSFFTIGTSIHVDQHFIAFDPQNPNVVFVGNDGGIFRSPDAGLSWSTLNTNLAITQFYAGISLHPTDPNIVMGGTQDNGTLQYEGLPRWLEVIGGDGGFTAIDFNDPNTRYGETQWPGGPRRSTGGGFILRTSGINLSDRAAFIPPLVMDPTDPARLYFGTYQLYRTVNRADSWTSISPDLTGGPGYTIRAIAPAPSNQDVVYVGSNGGIVERTTSGGTTWQSITSGLPLRAVTDIAVDPADWQTAYVTLSAFGTGHVYRTTNAGDNWQNVSGNLPDIPVNAVLVDPAERGTVFIGTDLGVFVTADSGGTWTVLDDGFPNVAVYDIAYNPTTGVLIAATHGRGMFSLTLTGPLTLAVIPRSRADSIVLGSETAPSDSAMVLLSGINGSATLWTATHGDAPWITLTTASGKGNGSVRWDRDPSGLPDGTYVDTILVDAPGAAESPLAVIDSLIVWASIRVSPQTRETTTGAGAIAVMPDSAEVTLAGPGSESESWSVEHGSAPWLTVLTQEGIGNGVTRWIRNPRGLRVGRYTDTITVTTLAGRTARIIDHFTITAPNVAPQCAADHLLGTDCLSDDERRYLDLEGNGDNVYNLGDFLALLARLTSVAMHARLP